MVGLRRREHAALFPPLGRKLFVDMLVQGADGGMSSARQFEREMVQPSLDRVDILGIDDLLICRGDKPVEWVVDGWMQGVAPS